MVEDSSSFARRAAPLAPRFAGGLLLAVGLHAAARTQVGSLANALRALNPQLPEYNGEVGALTGMWYFSPEEHAENTLAMTIYGAYLMAVFVALLPTGPALPKQPLAGLFWVAVLVIVIVYKSQKTFDEAIYICMPCHFTALMHAYGCFTGSRTWPNIGHTGGLILTVCALVNPDTRGADLFLEFEFFWFQHIAMLVWSVWDMSTFNDGCGVWWCWIAWLLYTLYYYLPGVWMNIYLATNINYMMAPFVGAPFGRYYRVFTTCGFIPGVFGTHFFAMLAVSALRRLRFGKSKTA